MRRTASDSASRIRLALTLLAGALVTVLVPSSLTDSASAVVIATLAFAVAAVVEVGTLAAGVPSLVAATSLAEAAETPLHRPARVTDPVHHPIRPRAPGV